MENSRWNGHHRDNWSCDMGNRPAGWLMYDLWWQLSRSKRQTAPPGTKPAAGQPWEPVAAGENPNMLELAAAAGPDQF